MVRLNFSVFKEKLLDGTKQQTMRKSDAKRDEFIRLIKRGRRIQVYWKCNSFYDCEYLFEALYVDDCYAWFVVRHDGHGLRNGIGLCLSLTPPLMPLDKYVDGQCVSPKPLTKREADGFAKADGFKDFNDMVAWFRAKYGDGFIEPVYRVIRFRRVGHG